VCQYVHTLIDLERFDFHTFTRSNNCYYQDYTRKGIYFTFVCVILTVFYPSKSVPCVLFGFIYCDNLPLTAVHIFFCITFPGTTPIHHRDFGSCCSTVSFHRHLSCFSVSSSGSPLRAMRFVISPSSPAQFLSYVFCPSCFVLTHTRTCKYHQNVISYQTSHFYFSRAPDSYVFFIKVYRSS
jgi:hypothetical protein